MPSHILPLRPDLTHYRFTTELEGIAYAFEFRWNVRAEGWWMALLTADDQPILRRRVVLGVDLLETSTDLRLPPGLLEAIDTAGTGVEPGFAELGARVLLMYTDAADLAAVA